MRLLCADDEEDIRVILELALSLDPEIDATIVSSGTELLDLAVNQPWDGFVLDGMMPGIDGYETCRRLKSDPRTSAVPVVFVSAKTRQEEIAHALSLGARALLPKPFDPMTLAAELRAALGV